MLVPGRYQIEPYALVFTTPEARTGQMLFLPSRGPLWLASHHKYHYDLGLISIRSMNLFQTVLLGYCFLNFL